MRERRHTVSRRREDSLSVVEESSRRQGQPNAQNDAISRILTLADFDCEVCQNDQSRGGYGCDPVCNRWHSGVPDGQDVAQLKLEDFEFTETLGCDSLSLYLCL